MTEPSAIDLVERLHGAAKIGRGFGSCPESRKMSDALDEAADTITRLQAALDGYGAHRHWCRWVSGGDPEFVTCECGWIEKRREVRSSVGGEVAVMAGAHSPLPSSDKCLLAWLDANKSLELSWGEVDGDPSDCAWRVHRSNGGEWTLVATGETPADALGEAFDELSTVITTAVETAVETAVKTAVKTAVE